MIFVAGKNVATRFIGPEPRVERSLINGSKSFRPLRGRGGRGGIVLVYFLLRARDELKTVGTTIRVRRSSSEHAN